MTLLLTWVVPDGIVMGADSALSWPGPGGIEMTLSDAYKIAPCVRSDLRCALSFCGLAMIGKTWTANWLRDYITKYSGGPKIVSLAQQLASDLNRLGLGPQLLGLQIAGWERVEAKGVKSVEPRFYEVSNVDRSSGKVCGHFSVIDILYPEFLEDIKKYHAGDKTVYPMRFGSAGVPQEFSTYWIEKMLIPAQTKLAGVQVPQPHITSVAEYVRFLIGFVADTQRVARQPAAVNRPVETLILFPDYRDMVSMRY